MSHDSTVGVISSGDASHSLASKCTISSLSPPQSRNKATRSSIVGGAYRHCTVTFALGARPQTEDVNERGASIHSSTTVSSTKGDFVEAFSYYRPRDLTLET